MTYSLGIDTQGSEQTDGNGGNSFISFPLNAVHVSNDETQQSNIDAIIHMIASRLLGYSDALPVSKGTFVH